MTETELLNGVLAMAGVFGWRSFHVRPARTSHGWRSAVQGDGKGFPDLILLGHGRHVVAELKSSRGTLTDEQRDWLDAFEKSGAEVFVWRPADWADGSIEKTLRTRP
jgi:VRR-NUC domain